MIQPPSPTAGPLELNGATDHGPTPSVNGVSSAQAAVSGIPLSSEHIADLNWGYDQAERGCFAEYAGKNVAILSKAVVGADASWGRLREDVASKYGVDPERIVVIWIHEPDFVVSAGGA